MNRYGNFGHSVPLFDEFLTHLEEADSKADFPGWLWGPIRRAVWRGYDTVQPQWERYAGVESVPDFRPQSMFGLGRLRGFAYVGDNGEYVGMKRTEFGGPTYSIDTYGAMYGITRQAIINDTSNQLLNRNPEDMGEESALYIAEGLVALIESNPTAWDGTAMYHSSRGNITTAALSEDSLVDALTAMATQRDLDNRRIRVRPRYLIVQNARWELVARRIINSSVTGTAATYTGAPGAGTNIFDKGTDNPLQGIMPGDAVVNEPFFTDTNDWYLFADVGDVPAFIIAFLNGKRQPSVFLKDPGVRSALGGGEDPYSWEGDAIDFKIRHDFGFAAMDPKGTYKGVVA